ncbi:MAG: T9SS type A sorting domain-containing protein [Saprospiraceae bacterium]|nr:T9SS type A sorting domain-containing protein [Saprospiraceae bacterium]
MGACAYNLKVQVKAEDLCGLTEYHWDIRSIGNQNNLKIQDSGKGSLKGIEQDFSIISQNLFPGTYRLEVHLEDECNNESKCFYDFSIKSVKKPSPVCYTSLTARLTPWDRDQDGTVDTAHAIIWASEFDRSSSPTCGDDSLEFRLELLDGSPDDDSAAGDLDFLELGCDHIGTRLVRLWVISYPSQTIDYCDVVLIVQSDYTGCSAMPNGDASEFERMQNNLNHISDNKFMENADNTDDVINLSVSGLINNNINSEMIRLEQNNPNPFMSETSITFTLPRAMHANLTIFDTNGKVVRKYSGSFNQGSNQVAIRREELPSTSVLFYRLDAENYSEVKRMILIK